MTKANMTTLFNDKYDHRTYDPFIEQFIDLYLFTNMTHYLITSYDQFI